MFLWSLESRSVQYKGQEATHDENINCLHNQPTLCVSSLRQTVSWDGLVSRKMSLIQSRIFSNWHSWQGDLTWITAWCRLTLYKQDSNLKSWITTCLYSSIYFDMCLWFPYIGTHTQIYIYIHVYIHTHYKFMKYIYGCIYMYFIKNTYVKYLYIYINIHPPKLPFSISIYCLKLLLDLSPKMWPLKLYTENPKSPSKF